LQAGDYVYYETDTINLGNINIHDILWENGWRLCATLNNPEFYFDTNQLKHNPTRNNYKRSSHHALTDRFMLFRLDGKPIFVGYDQNPSNLGIRSVILNTSINVKKK
jgi:hypothetical protein